MSNTVDKVIKIALDEVGYMEKSKKAYNKDPKVLDSKEEGAGTDNLTKYGRDMHELYPQVMDFGQPWCDCFVDWCFYKAYGETEAKALLGGDFNDYTKYSAKFYEKKGTWHTSNPHVGDQIFFKNNSGICHTGLVYKVDKGYVYTIEGNTSLALGVVTNGCCVRTKSYSIEYERIAGYGRPNYDVDPNTQPGFEVTDEEKWQRLVADLQKALNAEFDAGLVVDGIAGKKTLAATPNLSIRTRSTKPNTVMALQGLLTYWDYKCVINGDYDFEVEKQVKNFQREKVKLINTDGEFWAQKRSWKVLLSQSLKIY
jgi:hypothetical protein